MGCLFRKTPGWLRFIRSQRSLASRFLDVKTTFRRLEANAKHRLDPEFVHSLG
jgi:hypothetical protein